MMRTNIKIDDSLMAEAVATFCIARDDALPHAGRGSDAFESLRGLRVRRQ